MVQNSTQSQQPLATNRKSQYRAYETICGYCETNGFGMDGVSCRILNRPICTIRHWPMRLDLTPIDAVPPIKSLNLLPANLPPPPLLLSPSYAPALIPISE